MCGIVGYLGSTAFQEYILCGLKLLQNRGYDSVGMCTIVDGQLNTIKHASSIDNTNNSLQILEDDLLQGEMDNKSVQLAIGHTRWATHGGKTKINAHPHHDNQDRIALVHNGIIENFQELKNRLLQEGYFFRSQTDTEVVAVLLGKFLDQGLSMDLAIQKTVAELSGTWALVILHRDFPNKLWITRNGSPLLLGLDDNFIMVASEQIAFGNYIQKYIVLDNHDLIEVTKTEGLITYSKNIQRYAVKEKAVSNIDYNPTDGHKHWMIKEIEEQPDAVSRALNNSGRIDSATTVRLGGLDSCKARLLALDHLILLGCGTSFHAGLWSLEIFKSLDIFDTVAIYDGAEFQVGDIPKKGKTGLVLLSQSGETKDLHRCLQIAKDYDLVTIGIVNVPDSLIARETDCGTYLNAGREVAVASTKSFTNQCTVLALVAVWFSQGRGTALTKRQKIIQDLRNLSFQIQAVIDNRVAVQRVVDSLSEPLNSTLLNKSSSSMFLLGKGQEEAIAKEGALKMKEIAYIHAEGYSSSALKHGPFALIEKGLPIILFDVCDKHRDKTRNAFQEVLARDALVITISDQVDHANSNNMNVLHIDKNGTFGGVLANVYVQLLSYHLANIRGINPDFPRNLAKVVTVE